MKKLLYRLATLTLLVPAASFALGVGEMEVKSKLNEPLRAEIELIYSDSAEPAETEVRLASPADFERVGLDRGLLPVQLNFEVVRNDQGNYIIEVTSRGSITEPFLDFLIEVEWENGRLLREYVVLLDPPVSAREERAVEVSPVTEPVEQPVTEVPEEPEERPVSRPSPRLGDGETYGPVSRGDTLWEIARDWKPSDAVTINQMMVMLLRMNPDAFYDDNVNALKEGAILRLPQPGDFDALADSAATSQVKEQNELWNAYVRSRTGREVPTISDAGTDAEYDIAAADPGVEDESRLELVPPAGESTSAIDRPGGAEEQQVAELRDDLSRAREDLVSARQENSELEDRVGELEDLIASMERAISLKDASLADLQAQLEEARQATGDQPPQAFPEDDLEARDQALAETDAADDFGAEPTATDDFGAERTATEDFGGEPTDAGEPEAEPTAETGFGAEPGDEADLTGTGEAAPADTAADAAPPQPTPEVTRPPQPEPGLLANPLVWAGAALLLLLLAGGGFMMYRRRQAGGEEEYELFGPAGEEAGEEESEPVHQPPPEPAAAPPAEAGESVESLRAAVTEEPNDPQNHLALLRYHYAADDREAFLEDAEQMRGQVGESHPAWMEVKAMGANIAPGAALFADREAEEDEADESEDMDFELEGSEVDEGEDEDQQTRMMGVTGEEDLGLGDLDVDGVTGEQETPEPEEEQSEDDALDLDFGLEDDEEAPSAERDQPEAEDDLDFDLDFEPEPEAEGAEDGEPESREEDDLGLDFELEEDESQRAPTADEPLAAEPEEEDVLGDLDLEGDSEEETAEAEDESLDLDDLGLDLDTDETPSASLDEDAGDEHTEFDLEAFEPEAEKSDRSESDTAELELDLDLDDDEAPAEDEAPVAEAESAGADEDDLADLELDDLDLSVGEAGEDDSTGTKLDLARAYIDMGDPDGARGMLEEVMAEGSEEQKSEAQSLLDDLNS